MNRLFLLLPVTLFLAACVDTTGISPESSRQPTGNPNASVTVQLYSDFECPACRIADTMITKPLLATYGSRIRFEHQQFPLPSHQLAIPLAEASECAADQGKFWEFADMAYERQREMDDQQKRVTMADIQTWAQDLNLNMDLFGRCTRSRIKRPGIMEEFQAARARGVPGTPTFFVNGTQLPSDLAELTQAIEAALQQGAGRAL